MGEIENVSSLLAAVATVAAASNEPTTISDNDLFITFSPLKNKLHFYLFITLFLKHKIKDLNALLKIFIHQSILAFITPLVLFFALLNYKEIRRLPCFSHNSGHAEFAAMKISEE